MRSASFGGVRAEFGSIVSGQRRGNMARKITRRSDEGTNEQRAGRATEGWAGTRAAALDWMIGEFEKKFRAETFKASVPDYVRLLQARRDLGEERPHEVTVSWLDSSAMEKLPA